MSFGSTSGRGFENEFALYLWGAIFVIAVLVWVISHRQHQKWDKEDKDRNGQDE